MILVFLAITTLHVTRITRLLQLPHVDAIRWLVLVKAFQKYSATLHNFTVLTHLTFNASFEELWFDLNCIVLVCSGTVMRH
jgi:hypothetical protein